MLKSSLNISFLSPSTTPILGKSKSHHLAFLRTHLPPLSYSRWHEQNPLEIQAHAEACIEGAMKSLVAQGYRKDSVKVIGIPGINLSFPLSALNFLL